MKITRTSLISATSLLIGGFIGASALVTLAQNTGTWTNPLHTPPTCLSGEPGCDAPINVGKIFQERIGNLQIDGTLAVMSGFRVATGTMNTDGSLIGGISGKVLTATDDLGDVAWAKLATNSGSSCNSSPITLNTTQIPYSAQNTTGNDILVEAVGYINNGNPGVSATVGASANSQQTVATNSHGNSYSSISFIVPVGYYYTITSGNGGSISASAVTAVAYPLCTGNAPATVSTTGTVGGGCSNTAVSSKAQLNVFKISCWGNMKPEQEGVCPTGFDSHITGYAFSDPGGGDGGENIPTGYICVAN